MPATLRMTGCSLLLGGLSCLLAVGLAPTAGLAQFEGFGRLGLSAAPDHYVGRIDLDFGEQFTLYIIAQGPEDGTALPFDLVSVDWAIFLPCCGAAYNIIGVEYNDGLSHEGHPFTGVSCASDVCLDSDYLTLATLTLELEVDGSGVYLLPAGATGPAYNCAGERKYFFDLAVEAHVGSTATPNEGLSWGSVKALYD